MEEYGFTQGVRPGGLTHSYEVSILICYVLDCVDVPLTFFQLNESLQKEQLVNYFEFAGAIDELERRGQIAAADGDDGEKHYQLTREGKQAANTLESSLPKSVRERAVKAAEKVILLQKREKQNPIFYEKVADGYILTIRMQDVGSDLLQASVFLPTLSECERVKLRFLENPEAIYKNICKLLLGDETP